MTINIGIVGLVRPDPDLTVQGRFVIDDEAGEIHYFLTVNDPWALTETFEKGNAMEMVTRSAAGILWF